MGKRKRSTSWDRRHDAKTSPVDDQNSEASSHRKKVKRIKQEIFEDHHFTAPSTAFSSSFSGESKRMNGPLQHNGLSQALPSGQQMDECQDDDYDVWLVRKPLEVSIEELKDLKFPKKAKSSSKSIEISNCQRKPLGFTDQLDCRFERVHSQMFHIHTKNADNAKSLRNLKPYAKVKGVAWISQTQNLIDEFPVLPDEDFLSAEQQTGQQNSGELGIPSPPFMPFTIESIRRKPELDLEELKERLKAFSGVHPSRARKSRKKMRN